MKKVVLLSVIASTFMIAGGDIAPVEPMIEVPAVVEEVSTSSFYLGLAYGYMGEDYTRTADGSKDILSSFDESFSSIMLQAGYAFNPYIAVEGRYWAGLDDITTGLGNIIDGPDAWGIYAKPMYPVTAEFDVYALLGYAYTDTNMNKIDGFSWGLGTSYSFTENISIFVDYVSLYDDNIGSFVNTDGNTIDKSYTIDTVNVGVSYNF